MSDAGLESAASRQDAGRTESMSDASGRPELELIDVEKIYRGRNTSTKALTDINLSVRPREFISIIGQSGCGKTTLLRILAGLIRPTSGEVRAEGRSLWLGDTRDEDTISRLGLVFQEANLFPWYTVEDNIALPLRLRGMQRNERRARAHELCRLVGLSGFETSYPRELSGGMRQRASIARALSYRPGILLMDEPFGALDALTRDNMNLELQSIAEATHATVVLVTHSINEAVFLADRVVLLSPRPGRIRSVTEVPFARPREVDLQTRPEFQNIARELRHQLDEKADDEEAESGDADG
jgi:NitT/TauT family transport system ATP-binding protein